MKTQVFLGVYQPELHRVTGMRAEVVSEWSGRRLETSLILGLNTWLAVCLEG
jgi:hypothetical protein